MTTARLRFVHFVIAVVVIGHLLTIAFDPHTEAWPFSQYSMYSSRPAAFPRLGGRRLYVVAAGDGRELALSDATFLDPLDAEYLSVAFTRLLARGDRAALRAALRNCALRYETRRRSGAHAGPPLAALRLYELWWTPDPALRNVSAPDRRRLVAEYP